ncbi:TetR/AcrR family transcriptional regulator [Arthrobacter sp. YN]|uniref:TetR/AcrR family transcriptional regulator n=1 Tax=Arthrobacter sp. YN TaxID=2020486 RepID=UPI000B60154A|nr:TetR/AcrR family transcriptional regulator [Arthrobacter sp. YN]ASN20040.1 TetR family transcriptional regulator [Arthrobacter sp. YN]
MESTTAPRKRYAKTLQRRSAVARAALDVILEKGHRALTTSEVAARASMSETAMLYHFPTRDHILVAAMELADTDYRAVYTAEFHINDAENADWPPPAMAHLTIDDEAITRLFLALSAEAVNPEHPAHGYLKDHHATVISEFTKGVERRQAQGIADPRLDPSSVARQMMAAWSGLRMQWLVDPTFDLVAEVAQAFRALNAHQLMQFKQEINDFMSER